ncbi:pyridoxal phosphate-dependent decarboxylase family protein [Neolewinella persica]|uniref:pyridoxal phosphate-dependent decarboxylase family protein n=1 Tax=Neolewinella persica TaxID=70998 RepID=UPI000367639C|nr:pyridoxal-dependent decarboxylase [Neolewinella persica]
MDNSFLRDEKDLRQLLDEVRDFALTFRSDDQLPAGSTRRDTPKFHLSDQGAGTQDAISVFKEQCAPYLVASPSNRYLGFVTGGSTPAALAGDWLASAVDQNPQAVAGRGDVSAAIELGAIDLLRQLFNLPEVFNGGFVTGATMSAFTCLGVARQWVAAQQGYDLARAGLRKPIPVLAATPHSSAVKCLAMLGIGSQNLIQVATLPGREAVDMDDLQAKIEVLNGQPFLFIASGGTVNTVDFDDLAAIARLKKKHNFWYHVDAAFGGFAAVSPEHAHLLTGWESADSITIDNHKWLNVPYDSGCWFIRKEHLKLQVATFQNSAAPYLGDPAGHFNYLNSGPENSRRLRALPAWFSLMAYGRQGYRDIVERCIGTARSFGKALTEDKAFTLLAPVRLNVVAFTLYDAAAQTVDALVQQLNDRGRYFMTPTTMNGTRGIRAAFVNWQNDPAQVSEIMSELHLALKELPIVPATPP